MPEKEARLEAKVSVESLNLGQKRGNSSVSLLPRNVSGETNADMNTKSVKMEGLRQWVRKCYRGSTKQ